MESVVEVEKMIASSPHNTATRNRGDKKPSAPTPVASRKVEGTPKTDSKKRPRNDDEDDEPDDKRSRRQSVGGKTKDEESVKKSADMKAKSGGRKKT